MNLKNKLRFIAWTISFVLIPTNVIFAQASYTSSVVRVYGYKQGQAKVGTGSFVSVAGKSYILTCYHILSGCDKFEIRSSSYGLIEGVSIVGYDNIKDIILLDYKKKPGFNPTTLQLGNVPSNLSSLEAITIGNPNSITEQKFRVRFTSEKGTILSTSLFDNNGNSIFKIGREYDFNVIPVDLTIYGGMSGAPVILNSFVIGILSGSVNTGGSLAWAIPSSYCNQVSILSYVLNSGISLNEQIGRAHV